ncbi:MAG: DUF5668 domain-containing protein [Spirochaetes bacterium]|jgi:hypothetical protein|nr:DUF5668 domain-containing protein [Spirochaetota bacterium]
MRLSFIWGSVVIAVGVVLLLNNLGFTDLSIGQLARTYWPIIFIISGINSIAEIKGKKNIGSYLWGVILIAIGAIIIAGNLNLFTFDWSFLWRYGIPVLLILIGINLFRSGGLPGKGNMTFMSGTEKNYKDIILKDSRFMAIMGGMELDLRGADIQDGTTSLNLRALMGGIEIKADPHVNYTLTATTILGGIEFFDEESGGIVVNRQHEHKSDTPSAKTIVITAHCMLGGIEIK